MFDFPELLNRASDMFKGSSFEDIVGANISDRLSELGTGEFGLDPEQLGEIQSLFDGEGVDLTSLTEGQLSDLLASVKESGSLEGIDLSQFFDRSPS